MNNQSPKTTLKESVAGSLRSLSARLWSQLSVRRPKPTDRKPTQPKKPLTQLLARQLARQLSGRPKPPDRKPTRPKKPIRNTIDSAIGKAIDRAAGGPVAIE